jgi:hypothetical protein
MYWNIHPLPHTPLWHNASLVKHRDNFTFYLYWNIKSCLIMLPTVHFTWMYSLKSFPPPKFFLHLPCCYGAFSALRKQSLSGALIPTSSLITAVLTPSPIGTVFPHFAHLCSEDEDSRLLQNVPDYTVSCFRRPYFKTGNPYLMNPFQNYFSFTKWYYVNLHQDTTSI